MGMIIWDMREFRDPPKDPRAHLSPREVVGWSSWPSQDREAPQIDGGGKDRVEDGQNAEGHSRHL